MDINNLDINETQNQLQTHVKSESDVTFQGVPVMKMNFKDFFTIVENEVGFRIFLPRDQTEFKSVVDQILVDGQPLEIIYSEYPFRPTYGTCPVCNGTKEVNSNVCTNCGGQYESGIAKGIVLMNNSGNPCTHQYESFLIRNTYTQYQCQLCRDVYYETL